MAFKYYDFNLNNSVKVKLNDIGRAELKRQHDELYASLSISKEYTEKSIDDEGYSRFQMHDLMRTFGHMMTLGFELPFDRANIRIAELNLKEVANTDAND